MNEEFIKKIYASIVEENVALYKKMYSDLINGGGDNLNAYSRNLYEFYHEFDKSQQKIFFNIIQQVIIDTISNVFGVIDGICGIDDNDWNFKMSVNGQDTNGELQDSFLEYVETIEQER